MTDQSLRLKTKQVVPATIDATPPAPPKPTLLSRLRRLNLYTLLGIQLATSVLAALMVMYHVNALTAVAHNTADTFNQALQMERATTTLRHYFDRFERDFVEYRYGQKKDLFGLVESFTDLRTQCRRIEDLLALVPVDKHLIDIKHQFGASRRQIGFDLTSLTTNPAAIESIGEHLNSMHAPLGEVVRISQHYHTVRYERAKQQVAEAKERIWILAPIAVLCWLVSMLLLVVVMLRSRRQTRALEIETEKIAVKSKETLAAKNRVLGIVSHELKTPLQTIVGTLDLLLEMFPTEEAKRILNRLFDAVGNVERQVKDLADYARLDSGKVTLHEEDFNPSNFTYNILEEYMEAARNKGLTLTPKLDNRDLRIATDPYRFQQIVNNLVSNAIKYTEKGAVSVALEVHIGEPTTVMVLRVHDSGPGIDPEHLERIFEPFTQIDQTSTRRHEGSGMGLSIVQKLVELLNGKLDVHSTVGRGTRFDVTIPVKLIKGEQRIAHYSNATDEMSDRYILLVDDNFALRETLEDLVHMCGFQCDIASGGHEALMRLNEKTYSAVLLDINMPDIDGYEVAARTRRRTGPNQKTPLIAITGNSYLDITNEQRTLFSHLLEKPVHLEQLNQVLQATTVPLQLQDNPSPPLP